MLTLIVELAHLFVLMAPILVENSAHIFVQMIYLWMDQLRVVLLLLIALLG